MRVVIIVMFIGMLTSCNVIYRYSHESSNKLQSRINRKLPKGYDFKIIDQSFILSAGDHESKVNFQYIDRYSISYNPTENLIFILPSVDCNNVDSVCAGCYKTNGKNIIYIGKRFENRISNNRNIKIVELILNVVRAKTE